MEGIAARAGVGKQTIYRWWPSKGAVLLDALDRQAVAEAVLFPETGDLLADLRAMITIVVRLQAQENFRPHLTALIAAAQQDPALRTALVERLIRPRRAPILARLRRAQDAGQLPESVPAETVLELIFGALYHRLLLRTGPLDDDYAAFVVETVLRGCAA
jgi:AcrR family transcriptional regulator